MKQIFNLEAKLSKVWALTATIFFTLPFTNVNALTLSFTTPIDELLSGSAPDNEFSLSLDLDEITGYDVSGGQLLIQNSQISINYNQIDYLDGQPDTFTQSGAPTAPAYNLTYNIPGISFEGENYNIVGDRESITTFITDRNSSTGQMTVAGANSTELSFLKNQSSFTLVDETYIVTPDNFLLRTQNIDKKVSYQNVGSALIGDFDLLSLINPDGILDVEFLLTTGEIELDSLTLSFDFSLNPDWVENAINSGPVAVDIPPAFLLVGTALIGLIGIKRQPLTVKSART